MDEALTIGDENGIGSALQCGGLHAELCLLLGSKPEFILNGRKQAGVLDRDGKQAADRSQEWIPLALVSGD